MKNIKIIIAIAALVLSHSLSAQNDVSIHLLQIVPQSCYTNPSFSPQAKVYVGLPAFSSIYFGLSHSGFAYRDLVKKRADDSLYLDFNNMLEKMGKSNYLSLNYNHELLAFGFRVKKNYFSFAATEKIATRMAYPRDLFSLLWKGNTQFLGQEADFSGIGVNFTHYREMALGYNREIMDKLTVGVRAKVLFGLSNVWTQKSDITLSTDPNLYDLTARSHIILNTTLPEALYDNMSGDTTPADFNFGNYIMNTSNKGLAFDIGGTYQINDKFSVAASVLDIGKIKWTKDARNYTSDNVEFTFEGIDLNDFFGKDSTDPSGVEILMDSLAETFQIKETKNSYSSWLPPVVYLTGMYNLTGKDKVGAMVRGDIFNGGFHPSLTISYNKKFLNMFHAVGTYSILNRSFLNLGFGFGLQLSAMQFYVFNDNIYGLFFPTSSRNANIHFGFNFLFGYKEKAPEAPLIN